MIPAVVVFLYLGVVLLMVIVSRWTSASRPGAATLARYF